MKLHSLFLFERYDFFSFSFIEEIAKLVNPNVLKIFQRISKNLILMFYIKTKDMKKVNRGFTLVELIVVITILSVLGTISFLSIQGYNKFARNAIRVDNV